MYSLCPGTTFDLDETSTNNAADIAKHDALCYPKLDSGSTTRTVRATDYIQIGKIYLSGSQNFTL